jgi:hypothetical protein
MARWGRDRSLAPEDVTLVGLDAALLLLFLYRPRPERLEVDARVQAVHLHEASDPGLIDS